MTSYIPFSLVSDPDRARNTKKYGDLESLKASIQRVGLIQPIVLARNPDETFHVIAGGRRFRALRELGTKELFHGVTIDPLRPGYIFADEVPPHVSKEAELDENLYRLEMDWIDSTLLVSDVHKLKSKLDKEWGYVQTATILGKGYDRIKVGHAVRIAALIRAGDKEMLACKNISEAIQLRAKRNEDKALAELTARSVAKHTKKEGTPVAKTLSFQPIHLGGPSPLAPLGDGPIFTAPPTVGLQSAPVETVPKIEIPLSSMFWNMDFLDWEAHLAKDECKMFVDHIVTDIPYAIDMDNLDSKSVEDVKDEHDVEFNLALMPEFLSFAFRVIRPGGFCVFCYDLDHHEKLQTWAAAAGFLVQRWPYIICKTSMCKNSAAQYNTTKNYEAVMFLRKDSRTVLRKPVLSSWGTYDFAPERKLYNNPFAKPYELWKFIYDAIAFPGQSVLDPFCGEMSASRAAANCGLTPFGIELKSEHYNRGLQHMRAVFSTIHKNNVSFT